jgi:Lrp/AsnC family transcriptional regulator, regulator for asnA, asnC and gidA
MHNIDEQIIARLQRYNAPRTRNEMAAELGVSPATVKRHVDKLIKAGVVSILVLVDPEKVGLPIAAILGIKVEGKKLGSITETLKNRNDITWLASSIGEFDIMALARFSSMEHLRNVIQGELLEIDGVTGAETFLCLQEIKNIRVTR